MPLWNPYQGCGVSQIANPQSALFYPLNIFLYLFNWKWGLLLLYFFEFFLIGLFAYLYLTEITIDYRAAIVASIAAMYSCLMVEFNYPKGGAAFCFFLGLWAIELIIKYSDRIKGYVLLMLAFVITVFTGHPEILFFMTFALGMYFFIRLFSEYGFHKKAYIILGKAGLFIGIGVLVSAIQWLPFIEYLHISTILSHRESIENSSFYSIRLLLPAIGSFLALNLTRVNPILLPADKGRIVMGMNYIDPVFFLFGIAGIINLLKERRIRTYILLCVVTMIIPFNIAVVRTTFVHIPGFDITDKAHLLVFSGYFLLLIGAHYLDALVKGRCKPLSFATAVYATLFLGGILFVFSGRYYKINFLMLIFVLITMAIAIVLIMRVKNKNALTISIGIVLLLFTIMEIRGISLLSSQYFFPTNPIINKIKQEPAPFRVLPVIKYGIVAYEPNVNTFYNIEDLRNYDRLGVRWYDKFIRNLATVPGIVNFLDVKFIIVPERAALAYYTRSNINLSGLFAKGLIKSEYNITLYASRYSFDIRMPVDGFRPVVSANGFTLYENMHAFSRAFMVYDYKTADTHDQAFDLVKQDASQLSTTAVICREDTRYASFIPGNAVAGAGVKPAPAGEAEGTIEGNKPAGKVSFEKYTPNYIKMRVDTSAPGLLVISNTYFPGWHASIDGKETKVLRTDYAFQGVFVPGGHHEVELNYMPLSFIIGLVVSLAGIAAIPCLYLFLFH